MKRIVYYGILLLCIPLVSTGQKFNKTDFYEADMMLLSKDYEKAQKTYEKLLRSDPENANLNFLNGLCLVHIQGRKKESIDYLRKAAPYASSDYKYGSPKEINAPLEVLKYYAIACKLNDDIPQSIELLNQYIPLLGKDKDEIDLANSLLESCYTAQTMQENPVYYSKSDLGSSLISDKSKQYPVVNHDETMLLYSVKGKYNRDDIYFSEKINGIWSEPVKLSTYLGVKSKCHPTSISFDNERVYFTVTTGLTTDIFYSFKKNNRWQKMIRVDKPVNGKGNDMDACESSDGRYLYFSSERKGGHGMLDIYRAEKDTKGNWGKPANLGPHINTFQNDRMPVINFEDSRLYFKSEGHKNMGGFDNFYATKTGDNEWSEPVNIGYPLNTTDDDLFYMPARNGNFAYVAMSDPAFDGNCNLYLLEILEENPYKKYEISGQISLMDGSGDFSNANIEVISTETYEKIFDIAPDPVTGSFDFELGSGNYMFNFIKPEYNIYTHLVDLSSGYSSDTYPVYPILEKTVPDVTEVIIQEPPAEEPIAIEVEEEIVEEPEPEPAEEFIPVADYSASGGYTIQIMASVHLVSTNDLNEPFVIEVQKGEDEYYRYITGNYNTIAEAENAKSEVAQTRYKDAFIRYYNLDDYLNKAVRPVEYTIQIMALDREISKDSFNELSEVKISLGDDNIYRYTIGEYASLASAKAKLPEMVNKGYKSAFIIATSKISNY